MLNNLINGGYIVDTDKISTLLHPIEFKDQVISYIKTAKRRILINCLYLENDESGQLVIDALKAAVRANPHLEVDIFLDLHRAMRSRFGQTKSCTNAQWYYDELYEFNQQIEQQHQLKRSPINVYGIPCNGRELFGVYHIKGYCFDDVLLYSGASINNNYFGYDTYRQDRYQIIESADIAQAYYEFTMRNFGQESELNSQVNCEYKKVIVNFAKERLSGSNKQKRLEFKNFRQNYLLSTNLQYDLAQQFNSTSSDNQSSTNRANDLMPGQVLITPIYGIGKHNYINLCVFDAIAHAQASITIYTPYFNFTKKLAKRIVERCRNGVTVKIIVSDKQANDFYSPPDSGQYSAANSLPYLYEINLRNFLKDHQDLIDQGTLEVYSWQDGSNSYHAKGLEIDQKIYIFTGSNLNLRSFNVDTENALLCYDPYHKLAPVFNNELTYFHQHTTRLTSYKQVDHKKSYPANVRRTLRRASLFGIDKLAKRLF